MNDQSVILSMTQNQAEALAAFLIGSLECHSPGDMPEIEEVARRLATAMEL